MHPEFGDFKNQIYFKSSERMSEIPDNSVQLIVTSPPYFNIKDYHKDGKQINNISKKHSGQIGDIDDYDEYIASLLKVWEECYRVLKPNGKLCINTPLMPMLKTDLDTHYNRHIYNINNDIEHSILNSRKLKGSMFLYDVIIWQRKNSTKRLMFGSYPYPRNFYIQNTIEYITVFVKDGIPENGIPQIIKDMSKLSQKEWLEYTKQIWNIPVPNKKDAAYGIHSAIMPEEIPHRLIRLFTFEGETVLDPFTGSGTTLKAAKCLNRSYVGYELYESYKEIINKKLSLT